MTDAFLADLACRLETLKADGLYKREQVIASPQQGEVTLETGAACINLCANNYLGLSNHPASSRPRGPRFRNTVSGCRRCGSSAAPRFPTSSWRSA